MIMRRVRSIQCAAFAGLLVALLSGGCYERVVRSDSPGKMTIYEPNVDKDNNAFQQFGNDVFGGPEKRRK